jgi:hypothetical protein
MQVVVASSGAMYFLLPGLVILVPFFLYARRWGGRAGLKNYGAVQQAMDMQYGDLAQSPGRHIGRVVLIAIEALMIAWLVLAFWTSRGPAGAINFRMLFIILFLPVLTLGAVLKSLRPTAAQWTYGLCIAGVVVFFFVITGLA